MSSPETFDWGQYNIVAPAPSQTEPETQSFQQSEENISEATEDFDWEQGKIIEQDSQAKAILRWLYQPVGGFLQLFKIPLALTAVQQVGIGEALGDLDELEERIPELMKQHPEAPWENYDPKTFREDYLKGLQGAADYFPTLSNVEREVEERTGIPLQPEHRGHRLARLGGGAGKIAQGLGGDPSQIGLAAVATPAISRDLEKRGLPEWLADLLSFPAGQAAGKFSLQKQIKNLPKRETPLGLEKRTLQQKPGRPPPPDGGAPPPPPESEQLQTQIGRRPPPPASEPLPVSSFEIAEEAGKELAAGETSALEKALAEQPPPPPDPVKGIRPQAPAREAAPSLAGRVRAEGEDIGIRPAPRAPAPAQLEERIANRVYPRESYNKTRTGTALKGEVMNRNEAAYSRVNEAYDLSRELNSDINTFDPVMVDQLIARAENIRAIPRPSGVEKQLLAAIDDIVADSVVMERGNITGFRDMNNQVLHDQIKSLRQHVDYDFLQGKPKNIFRPLIKDLQDSVIRRAQEVGRPEAAEALLDANKLYRDWSTTFDNDVINPYRNVSNRAYTKLYDKMQDSDNFVMIRDIIGDTQEGREILGVGQRDIAEKALKPYMDNPRNISQRKLDRSLRELEPVLDPQQIEGIREEISTAQRRFPKKVRVVETPEKVPIDVKAIQKYTDKTPEQIESMGNTRSGIRELRDSLGKTKRGKEIFDKFSDKKIKDILRGDKVKAEYSGKDLAKVMNNKKNFELISELTSPKIANDLLDDATKLGNQCLEEYNKPEDLSNPSQKEILEIKKSWVKPPNHSRTRNQKNMVSVII